MDGSEVSKSGVDGRWAVGLKCSRTGMTAPLDEPAFLSPAGAPWLVEYELDEARGAALRAALPGRDRGLWRYRELLPVADASNRVDLGEGSTPLIRLQRFAPGGARIWLKDESGNPTGSFKARGLSLAVNRARELGAPGVRLASAGNAAIAISAYAAAAGLPATVALPADTPATIETICRDHGAAVHRHGATLVESRAVLDERAPDQWDLSTFREPYRVEGKKTMGLEIAEQMGWRLPDWIVYPTGGGTGIVAMLKAFRELAALGLVEPPFPRLVMVQMSGCAPLVRAFELGETTARTWEAPTTKVWGLRVPKALADFLVLAAVRATDGTAVAVDEDEIAPAAAAMARQEGVRCGPEGAAVVRAVERLAERGVIREGQRVVMFQTGHPANYE